MTVKELSACAFKVLAEDGKPHHGGSGLWSLPNGKPGKWMPKITGKITPCKNGYHLCRSNQLVKWLGPVIYVAEFRGEVVEDSAKFVVSEARLLSRLATWNERTARLFACDCAEQSLSIFEKRHPEDKRPRTAIEVARKFALGEATRSEMAAAGAAARDAAWAAARDAAWAAAWDAAAAAAGDAAGDAAGAAAGDAARDAAGDAARAAAWAAAGDAAWAAAGAAAWDAAGDAAWAAAGAAALAAAGAWQTQRLMEYLSGERQ